MDNTMNDDLREYLCVLRKKIEHLASIVKACAEEMQEAILSQMPQVSACIARAAAEICGRIRAALIIERSRNANRRRREPRIAKPRPPIRKRQRVFRCRNNC